MNRRCALAVFLLPMAVLLAVFFLYPLLRSAWLSLHASVGADVTQFVGLRNFYDLAVDKLFWLALLNTTLYTALFLAVQVPASVALALLLNHRLVRWGSVFRLIFLLPAVIGHVFVAMLFALLLTPNVGLVNRAAGLVGFSTDIPWRDSPTLAVPALVLMTAWLTIGYGTVCVLAALQSVDRDLHDAAQLDGAGPLARFRCITLPAIRPVVLFLVFFGIVSAFQLFELPFIFFGGPGPGFRGLTVVMYLYMQGFQLGNLGYAAAIGWALVLLLSAFLLIGRRLYRSQP